MGGSSSRGIGTAAVLTAKTATMITWNIRDRWWFPFPEDGQLRSPPVPLPGFIHRYQACSMLSMSRAFQGVPVFWRMG